MARSINRQPKKKSSRKRKAAPVQESVYVYGIGEHEHLSRSFEHALPEAIEPGSRLELVASGRLAAIASRVPREDYGKAKLEDNLNNAEWTAARAVRHQNVLTHFSARHSIIPLRFGTIYWSPERVGDMLAKGAREFQTLLDQLRDKEEWGVNLFADQSKLREKILSSSPRLRELTREAESAPPGHAYLLQKKVQSLRVSEVKLKVREASEQIESRLRAASEDSARLQVAGWDQSERSAPLVQFAFLVEKGRLPKFRDTLEELAGEYTPLGFQFELTGPWPAYNFVSAETGREHG